MFGDVLDKLKRLFISKRKKLILNIKKKHKIDISDYDIVDYKTKTGLTSDNAVLMMILASADLDNRSHIEQVQNSCTTNYSSRSEDSSSSRSSRNDEYTHSYSSSSSSSSSD